MTGLKKTDLVYIDPVHGWHYHMKECWMAGPKQIMFEDIDYFESAMGSKFKPCACVLAYQSGRKVIAHPFFEVRS
jgi:hypothetical protein